MKKTIVLSWISFALCSFIFLSSCQGQDEPNGNAQPADYLLGPMSEHISQDDPSLMINTYVDCTFEDKSGALWVGTIGRGAIRYAGDSLEYFSEEKGMGGKYVREIIEDEMGNIWFATDNGITKYDGQNFTYFNVEDGLPDEDIYSLIFDKNGTLWVGTLEGVCQFNGNNFIPFEIPEAQPDSTRLVSSTKIINSIMEDSKGNIWFGTDGGAYFFDGKKLSNISEKDGLCDNSVNHILEDSKGDFWFATQNNGVCRMDGNSFKKNQPTFVNMKTRKGFDGKNTSPHIFEDNSGNIWFPIAGACTYKYDGQKLTDLFQRQGCISHTIRSTFEDQKGRLWFSSWLGLFRYDG